MRARTRGVASAPMSTHVEQLAQRPHLLQYNAVVKCGRKGRVLLQLAGRRARQQGGLEGPGGCEACEAERRWRRRSSERAAERRGGGAGDGNSRVPGRTGDPFPRITLGASRGGLRKCVQGTPLPSLWHLLEGIPHLHTRRSMVWKLTRDAQERNAHRQGLGGYHGCRPVLRGSALELASSDGGLRMRAIVTVIPQ